jgi:hypothetical protein
LAPAGARLGPCLVGEFLDEFGLCPAVVVAVVVHRGEPSFECAVPGEVVSVAAHVVTQQLIPGRESAGLDNMQTVRPGAVKAAAVQKPTRHRGVVKPIPQQVQVTLSGADPSRSPVAAIRLMVGLAASPGTTGSIVLNQLRRIPA